VKLSIETRVVRWPLPPVGAARGRTERISVLLRMFDDQGGVGYGEAAPLPGMSPDTIEDAVDALISGGEPPTSVPSACFAFETALASAEAYRTGVPMCVVLGGKLGESMPTIPVVDTPDEAQIAWALGVRTFKIKLGADEIHRLVAFTTALPDARFRVDANRSWPDSDVHALLDEMRRFHVDYVEEPTMRSRELVFDDRVRFPIALDESLVGITDAELAALHDSPRLAAVVIKPTLHGLARSLMISLKSRWPIISHALEGPIGFAACCEAALTCGRGQSMGLVPHAGLAWWGVRPRQPSAYAIRPAGPGLGFDELWRLDEFGPISEAHA
jgi:O-succinylbenzoate synthase